MTLEEGLELINNYKKGLENFLETLPEQSVQLGSEMIQVHLKFKKSNCKFRSNRKIPTTTCKI